MSRSPFRLFARTAAGGALGALALLLLPLAATGHEAKRSLEWGPTELLRPTRTMAVPSPKATHRYIVVLKDSVAHPAAVAEDQAEEAGGEVSLVYRHAIEGYAAILPPGEVEALEEDPRVKYVTPDRKVQIQAQDIPTGISRINAPENPNLDIDEADDVRVDVDVAVIDTGIDYEHPDLNVAGRTDCIPADEESLETKCVDGTGVDGHGHGSHVAGTIGALDNGFGVVGVAPGARLWAVKTMTDEGFGYTSWIIAGVDWVTAHAETIEVANMSLGGKGEAPALAEAIEASVDAGVVYVVAAGNEGEDAKNHWPANIADTIAVSAIADYDGKAGGEGSFNCYFQGYDDRLATFSNYGTDVDIAAPGVCIKSTWHDGGYETISGTSMASPHVAGAAAILAARDNPEGREDVEAIAHWLEDEGSYEWTDTSGDGIQEPLLDVSEKTAITGLFDLVTGEEPEATLHGKVNPRGLETSYRFEYDTTPYEEDKAGHGTSVPVPDESAGSGGKFVAVQETLKGLENQRTYHYRLVATNSEGTFYGADREFATTPPAALSGEASEVNANNATLNGLVNPEGGETTFSFEIGITASYGRTLKATTDPGSDDSASGTEAVAVSAVAGGLNPGRTYHYRLVAENLAGTSYGDDETLTAAAPAEWPAQSIPAPEGRENGFQDISCVSQRSCLAVGGESEGFSWDSVFGGEQKGTFAAHWDGEEWSTAPMPSVPGEERVYLDSISCASERWCAVVGETFKWPFQYSALAEHWDGEEWHIDSLPMPAGTIESELVDVSCASPSACTAVGYYEKEDGSNYLLVEQWDGTKWTRKAPPALGHEHYLEKIESVSCVDPSYCVAAGWYEDFSEYKEGVKSGGGVLLWNGTSWSKIQNLDNAELRHVACALRDACTVVGTMAPSWQMQAEHWDGKAWSAPESMAPLVAPGAVDTGLRSMECPALDSCTISGSSGFGFLTAPFVTHWDGSKWSIQSTAEPFFEGEEGFRTGGSLRGLSCPSPSRCLAAGAYVHSEGDGDFNAMIATYRTPGPDSLTDPPTRVTSTGAALHATVDPEGSETSYQFEYGTSKAYGTSIPAAPVDIGSGSEGVAVAKVLGGLKPQTTYHVRISATNEDGTTYGEDRAFTTGPAVAPGFVSAHGEAGTGNGQFSGPSGIAIDQDGDLWVTDTGNNRVQQFSSEGKYLSQFGTTGSGNGQLEEPAGIATDADGGLWIADTGNDRIQHFDSEGKYLSQFGSTGSGNGQLSEPSGIAIDQDGDLWVTDTGNDRIQHFDSEGKYLSQFGSTGTANGQLNEPTGIATDAEGDLWVTDAGNDRVQEFSPAGEYVTKFGEGGSGAGQLNAPAALAFDGNHTFWVTDSGNDRLQRWSLPAPSATTEAATSLTASQATLNASVNPNGFETTYRFEYDTTPYKAGEAPHGTSLPVPEKSLGSGTAALPASRTIAGLTQNTTYHYRVAATSWVGTTYGEDNALTTLKLPKATTEAASAIKADTATLNATLNPEGNATSYFFEYGTTTSYGTKAPTSPKSAGSGTSNVKIAQAIEGLKAGTTYHFRVAAESVAGTSYGDDLALTTIGPPKVTTEAATEVGLSSATLHGTVNPSGAATGYWFEYGITNLYGAKAPASAEAIGSGTSAVAVSQAIKGLAAGTPYHFRLVAENEVGTTNGTDQVFTTETLPTSLCKTSAESPSCAGADRYAAETAIEASASSFSLETSVGTISCSESALSAKSKEQTGKPLGLTVSLWTFSKCLLGGKTACTLSVSNLPASATLAWSEGSSGALLVPSGGSGQPLLAIKCGFLTNCSYTLPSLTLKGGSPASVAIAEGKLFGSGFCPETTTLKPATYTVNSPKPLYVAREGTAKAPKATTEAATAIGTAKATMHAKVNPEGAATGYHFEYDTAEYKEGEGAHGTNVPVPDEALGSGTAELEVAKTLEGLKEGTTYHFRVVAKNEVGTTYGKDLSFITEEAPADKRFDFSFGTKGSGNGQFSAPYGVATDSSGNVWVTDTGNNRVQKFNAKGEYLSQFGSGGTGNGQFSNPTGIAVDSSGNVWVSDCGNNRVQEFNSKGEFVAKFGSYGSGDGQLYCPMGLAFNSSGRLFVVDNGNHRVQQFKTSGEYVSKFGAKGTGNGAFEFPQGIAFDTKGRIWVTDTGNNRLQRFDGATYAYLNQFGSKGTGNGQFDVPTGIALDLGGGLWVVDSHNGRVQRFTEGGEYLDQIGTAGSGTGQMGSPNGIAVPANWQLLIADTSNHRIQHWTQVPDPPFAATEAATSITSSSATLNAKVNPYAFATTYRFEYDTVAYKDGEAGHGTSIPVPDEAIGSGDQKLSLAKAISGLKSKTKYYFRVVAANANGTTVASQKTFTTS